MKTFALFLCVLLSSLNTVTADDAGWQPLFDGRSLEGWTQKNGFASYRVEDGAIVGTTAPRSPNSFLCSTREYGNFELEFEVQVDKRLNSGVQIRSLTKEPTEQERKANKVGRVHGPQVEIEGSPGESGYIYGEATGRGWLTPEARLKTHEVLKNDDWNHFRIIAQGARIQTWINGAPIEDLTDEAIYETHPAGFIGLQVHGIGDRTDVMEVRWRNLRIRELNATE